MVAKAQAETTESWLRQGLPKGSGLPPVKVLAAQIDTLTDALAEALAAERDRYAAYIREHPLPQPVLKERGVVPSGLPLEWQAWIDEVVLRRQWWNAEERRFEVDEEQLASVLRAASREGVGTGAISGARAAGLLPAGFRELGAAEAKAALAEVAGLAEATEPGGRALYQALRQGVRAKLSRVAVLRDGAGRIVAAALYRTRGQMLEIQSLGVLERSVPGTGVQMLREIAGVAAAESKGVAVVAGTQSEVFFSGLGMTRTQALAEGAARFTLDAETAAALARGSIGPMAPSWVRVGWLEGPEAVFRFDTESGLASLVGADGRTLAQASIALPESGPLQVAAFQAQPAVERRMMRELATVAAKEGRGLVVTSGEAGFYQRIGMTATKGAPGFSFSPTAAATFASGLTRGTAFAGEITWELAVAGASDWLRAHRIKGVVDEIQATTHQALVDTLAEGLANGESTEALARRVMATDKAFGRVRAERIARTEAITANRMGGHQIAVDGGCEEKEWRARIGSPRTRPWHREAHGQRVKITEPYVVNNSKGVPQKLMVPGDYSLGAGPDNCANCRCSERRFKPGVTDTIYEPDQHGQAGGATAAPVPIAIAPPGEELLPAASAR